MEDCTVETFRYIYAFVNELAALEHSTKSHKKALSRPFRKTGSLQLYSRSNLNKELLLTIFAKCHKTMNFLS